MNETSTAASRPYVSISTADTFEMVTANWNAKADFVAAGIWDFADNVIETVAELPARDIDAAHIEALEEYHDIYDTFPLGTVLWHSGRLEYVTTIGFRGSLAHAYPVVNQNGGSGSIRFLAHYSNLDLNPVE